MIQGQWFVGVLLAFHAVSGTPLRVGLGLETSMGGTIARPQRLDPPALGPTAGAFAQLQWFRLEGPTVLVGARVGGAVISDGICSYVPMFELEGEGALVLGAGGFGTRAGGTLFGYLGAAELTHSWGTPAAAKARPDVWRGTNASVGLRWPMVQCVV
jgi:hypothetical protein